uniref:Uncharacterized protein n=1 Tax=Anguilla anguilla TaxID=7936 RepID=A0A0E9R6X2_ANGAN
MHSASVAQSVYMLNIALIDREREFVSHIDSVANCGAAILFQFTILIYQLRPECVSIYPVVSK